MPKVLAVLIDQINVGANRRPVKDDKVVELMQSIRANGLLNPITIDQNFNLIAGLHRLTACKMLSYKHVECKVVSYEDADQARLAEIDENFIRNELEPLERYELWLERDRILERMGLRFKPGDNQYTKKGGETVSLPPRTTLELARGFGYSERSFQQGKQIARDIHPDVKQKIITTPFKKSRTVQLKIARIATSERNCAEIAEKAFSEAMAKGDKTEAEHQAQLAKQARDKQKELQLQALEEAISNKSTTSSKNDKPIIKPIITKREISIDTGEKWMLHKHLVYRGKTTGKQFINLLPSDAALAIATLSPFWEHDYLINEARVVAVLRSQGHINNFCRNNKMPFQYELVLNQLYISVFSHHTITKPEPTICIEGIEAAISYLLNMYTNPNSFVISPFMGHGETLIACERLGRICFVGDESPDLINRGIARWQKFTNKQARKTSL
ncbi:MAG: ParB N-terminal domain-containing protein [Calothrix sp. FI2-JRJ7]|jgi:ParB family chromosome partitioning protein|nr:ParB N-terminal domain-containing protein [Calothrix sp. FI2-JRJ7]